MLFEKFPDGHYDHHLRYLNDNVFSSSESPCCPNVSYQVSVMVREEMSFEVFQLPPWT